MLLDEREHALALGGCRGIVVFAKEPETSDPVVVHEPPDLLVC